VIDPAEKTIPPPEPSNSHFGRPTRLKTSC
jgi:hypothetical protein